MKYVWVVYEINKQGKDSLFGIFSLESLAIKACEEFDSPEEYKIERYVLNP